jgi:hypothetical protein
MKRARIALTAIAVFAVVGGAVAFKQSKRIYVPTVAGGPCTSTILNRITTAPGQGLQTTATDVFGAACVVTFTTAPVQN